jgi:hypothetical protein
MLPRRVPRLARREAVLSDREEALSHRKEAIPRRVPMPSYVGGGLSHVEEAWSARGREASCPEKTPHPAEPRRPDAERGPSRRQKGLSRPRTMPPPHRTMPPQRERGPPPRGHAWSGLISARPAGQSAPTARVPEKSTDDEDDFSGIGRVGSAGRQRSRPWLNMARMKEHETAAFRAIRRACGVL